MGKWNQTMEYHNRITGSLLEDPKEGFEDT